MRILKTLILAAGVALAIAGAAGATEQPAQVEQQVGTADVVVAAQQPEFCIARDRCSLDVPVSADALFRYDAKMDAAAGR